ncbi:hypothetical protein Tco_0055757, partial [Tanacetum coccineum]
SSSTVVGAYEGDGVPVVDEGPNGVRVDEKAGEVPDGLNGLKDGVPNNVGVEDDDDDVVWLNGLKDGVPTSSNLIIIIDINTVWYSIFYWI